MTRVHCCEPLAVDDTTVSDRQAVLLRSYLPLHGAEQLVHDSDDTLQSTLGGGGGGAGVGSQKSGFCAVPPQLQLVQPWPWMTMPGDMQSALR